ncbi:MAG TPA: FAD-linked oxidase C-terminal domain-containing protein, partial [Jatrophihabitantaceae bacterium]|nr:FAD-linked oxidase C-terminal domain-containing protein [Jatrophihabitantaceae bacterium]
TAPGTGLPTLDLRAHLVSVQVVLADGQTVRAAGTASSGPTALGNLFVGSRGLLGVITEVTLRPTAPPDRTVALVAFDDPAVAGNAALELFFAAPSVEAQLLSRVTLSDPTSLAPGEGAVLLVSCSADDRRAVEDVGMAFGARQITVCPSGPDALLLLGASASAPAALRALGVSLGDPLAVPPTRLADFLDGVREIERDCGHQVISLVDVGIGAVQAFVLDADTATDTAEESLARLLDLACDLVQEATGAGNGRYSTAWTGRVLGGRFVESDRRMKLGLDPDGRLNPGLAY